MNMIDRQTLRQIIPFAPLLAAAVLSISVAAADKDVATAPTNAVTPPAAGGASDANTLAPVDAIVPAIHMVKVDRVVSGSEPDPESFDRVGLEHWWHNYQLAHSMRAENAKK